MKCNQQHLGKIRFFSVVVLHIKLERNFLFEVLCGRRISNQFQLMCYSCPIVYHSFISRLVSCLGHRDIAKFLSRSSCNHFFQNFNLF